MRQKFNQFAERFRPALVNGKFAVLKSKRVRQLVIGLLLLQIVIVAVAAWQIRLQANRELEAARAEVERRAFVPFEKRRLSVLNGDAISLLQSSKATRDLARFNDSYFAATEGGLVEIAADGRFKRRLTVLDGLPESDLTALAESGSQLFIGTRSQGLVSFDGSRFTAYRWTDRKAQAVTSLLSVNGRLLIGTFAGGLLEFDGKQFRELKPESDKNRIEGIDNLMTDASRLFVGTFADGLWIEEGSRWRHFTVADGLPSNRVVGVVANGERLLVATDFGIAVAKSSSLFDSSTPDSKTGFQTLATLPSLSGIGQLGDSILLCKDNGELFQLLFDGRTNRAQLNPIHNKKSESLSSCQLKALAVSGEQSLWLLSSQGIRRTGWQDERLSGRMNSAGFGEPTESNQPTSNLISALAFDEAGNLWAGSFRNGIDVFSREGRRLTHLESNAVREINSLKWDAAAKQMLAATSQGLVGFNGFKQSQTLGAADGLISNSILHIAPVGTKSSASSAEPGQMILATARGLMFGKSRQWRALTTVQGLPGNSVYTVLPHHQSIFAGTISGLAEIKSGRVVRVFRDSNSKLNQNWVTALCSVGNRLFVGTYGGGVFELTPSGELISFAAEIGNQSINPNAMATDGQRLFVGTPDGAWTLDFDSQKWTRLKAELPAPMVLSIAVDRDCVYFGTTGGIARIGKQRLEFVRE
ncbi:MAG: hypothetical protein AB7P14_07165 [Blastocatellales bacterium]